MLAVWCGGVVSGVCGARRMTGGWWLMAPAPGPEFWPRGAAELCQDQWNESWLLLPSPRSRAVFGPPSPWRSRVAGRGDGRPPPPAQPSPAIMASQEPETFV